MNVLSWNVWFNEATADSRYPQILDTINELNPEVVLLQEITPTFIEHYYQSELSARYYLFASKQANRHYGQAFFSKKRLFTTHNEPLESDFDRSVFFGLLQVNEHQAVLFVNVHLESGRFESSVRARQIEAINNQHLPAFLKKLNSNKESPKIVGIVWGGDFNLAGKEGHQLLSEYWLDAAVVFNNEQWTFDLKNNFLAMDNANWLSRSSRLDRFYIKQGGRLKAKSYKLLNTPLFGSLSDHYPIKMTLGLGL